MNFRQETHLKGGRTTSTGHSFVDGSGRIYYRHQKARSPTTMWTNLAMLHTPGDASRTHTCCPDIGQLEAPGWIPGPALPTHTPEAMHRKLRASKVEERYRYTVRTVRSYPPGHASPSCRQIYRFKQQATRRRWAGHVTFASFRPDTYGAGAQVHSRMPIRAVASALRLSPLPRSWRALADTQACSDSDISHRRQRDQRKHPGTGARSRRPSFRTRPRPALPTSCCPAAGQEAKVCRDFS